MLRRIIELFGSVLLLVFSSPLLLVTALAIWATDFGPVFYWQTRAGKFGRPFQLLKFRSMRMNNRPLNSPEEVSKNDPLVTPIGRLIRRLKVDELPQLINVVRGDMSWIGPRPTVLEQVEMYTPFQRRRLEILPGMTGWAQVNGGAELSWAERIILEVWYVEHRSLLLDVKILWRTLGVIMRGHHPNPQAVEDAVSFARQQADVRMSDLPLLTRVAASNENVLGS
jgi:lipopolysaccharide/colanic/teichoic acid biosynthesis glycosyltransferase